MKDCAITINGQPLRFDAPTVRQPQQSEPISLSVTFEVHPDTWRALDRVTASARHLARVAAARLYTFETAEQYQRQNGYCVVRRDPQALLRALFTLGLAHIDLQ
jgi:hypothetical protein